MPSKDDYRMGKRGEMLLTKVVQEQQRTIAELKKEVEGMKKGRM